MTHYLRRRGETIVEIETTENDLSCVVCIEQYSYLLLTSRFISQKVIDDFGLIQEIRSEWFEGVGSCDLKPRDMAARRLKELAVEYELEYVTD